MRFGRLIAVLMALLTAAPALGQQSRREHSTWATGGGRGGFQPPATVNNQTLRQIVRTSIGGNRVRIVLSNAFGTAPVAIGAASISLRDQDSLVLATSMRTLTFGGSTSGTILPGATLVSDAVNMTVALYDGVIDFDRIPATRRRRPGCCRLMIPAITCIPATPVTRRWARQSISPS